MNGFENRNPFDLDVGEVHVSMSAENESKLIELSCNGTFKTKFDVRWLDFWLDASSEYPELSEAKVTVVLLFSIIRRPTFLCEADFLAMTEKYRKQNRLSV